MVARAAARTQVVVVTHSAVLREALAAAVAGGPQDDGISEGGHRAVHLLKEHGETVVEGQTLLARPSWRWPER
ncbi:hypothetical protein ACI8AC_21855 [Geodermatophilus sp. SYSU D00758]